MIYHIISTIINLFFSVIKRVWDKRDSQLFYNFNFSMYSWEYNIPAMSIPRKNFLWNCQFHQDKSSTVFFVFFSPFPWRRFSENFFAKDDWKHLWSCYGLSLYELCGLLFGEYICRSTERFQKTVFTNIEWEDCSPM